MAWTAALMQLYSGNVNREIRRYSLSCFAVPHVCRGTPGLLIIALPADFNASMLEGVCRAGAELFFGAHCGNASNGASGHEQPIDTVLYLYSNINPSLPDRRRSTSCSLRTQPLTFHDWSNEKNSHAKLGAKRSFCDQRKQRLQQCNF